MTLLSRNDPEISCTPFNILHWSYCFGTKNSPHKLYGLLIIVKIPRSYSKQQCKILNLQFCSGSASSKRISTWTFTLFCSKSG